jgi:glyoxylase-like metal-dependent hydrolase (beta-lactamase superfamily II)
MKIKFEPMGAYQTNCYIITINNRDIIIDPGIGATEWVLKNVNNPIAILNTHGHFDHVWSNGELQRELKIALYTPKDDAFMLQNDPFNQGTPPSQPDILVNGDEEFNIDGIKIKYRHFAGHTRGNSIIEIDDIWLSGDFLFNGSIGRWDFPYSSAEDMVKSLEKAMKIEEDFTLYTGHGVPTTLKQEQKTMPQWINYVRNSI